MAVRAGDRESELIESLCGRIRKELPDEEVSPAEAFVRQYYHWVPEEDLGDRTQADLYGAAIAHWKLGLKRTPGEVKVRVYNPEGDRDGWSSPHTALEIVSDDMPFIVDSVTMELARQGYTIDLVIHPVMRVRRDGEGRLVEVLDPHDETAEAISESVLHAELVREPDGDRLAALHDAVVGVLEEVRLAVEDWQPMRHRALELARRLKRDPATAHADEVEEVKAFLEWVADDHFTFLGYREYELIEDGEEALLKALHETGLGILRAKRPRAVRKLSEKAAALARTPQLLLLSKANSKAPIHRPAYLDYIGVKRFDAEGKVTGEYRFLGLYTSSAYRASLAQIPLLRGKVKAVLERSGYLPASHDAKALLEILESYPRDVLFQFETDDLFRISMGVLGLGERQRVRLFVWEDPLDRFVWCLVTIPRDRFNTENRERIGKLLLEAFAGTHLDWTLQLSESVLVRVYYIVRCGGIPPDYDQAEIEARLGLATRAWTDELRQALVSELGEERGIKLYRRYQSAFPTGYRSDWPASAAVDDIKRIENLEDRRGAIINLYRPESAPQEILRCKLYSAEGVSLSEVLPTFEHMGARVMDERPYRVTPADSEAAWIYDFGLRVRAEDVVRVRDTFEEVFLAARRGVIEDDRLNGLVLAAELSGREIVVLRSVARYLRQAGIPYSDAYMERTLMAHPAIAEGLLELFLARFDPDEADEEQAERLQGRIEDAIDGVASLDEDRILRGFLSVITAMLRTSYFRRDASSVSLPYLAFKLDPSQITLLPKPRPRFEVFVYSPRFEAVHLRGGKVARGGIRWSDRPEDFRTEILGLMKAQMVKNALIVPVGAKGGFVLKRPPAEGGDALREEAVACYQMFLRGLLDLTDNIVDDEVVSPERVVRHDGEDTYLVVAADKGTARFSDIANEISADYGYWLGDAFASGGSHGYDHKQMGITARGAWESVKRHFRELGTDVESSDFTVVGIGDMSGDVFGNGMLLSKHIRLVAAFDHRHVFLDPDPDPEASFEARRKLFEQDRSTWADYDEGALSAGGGIYERTVKSIQISGEVREALGIDAQELSPPELIRAILRAPVDLLWNGGIGTYVKASDESHAEVGDKANDPLRVDARELRCRVVGEGGNLGFTQRARIEYALSGGPEQDGGAIYTDSIDNAAGVNTSDHEVNIKILLDAVIRDGELADDDRNQLLVEMTDAVAGQVLYASYTQTQAISLALFQAQPMIDVHARLIRRLEQVAGLDREIEFLPSEEMISDRKAGHEGLLAPELAIVMAYAKIHLYDRLLHSDLPEDEYLARDLEGYFPSPLGERYSRLMPEHRLRREMIATVVANQLVDRAGTTFAFRLGEETGASPPTLARGYAVARDVFEMRSFWKQVEELDNRIPAEIQLQMLIEGRRLVERATRWLVLEDPSAIEIENEVTRFKPGAELLAESVPEILEGNEREAFDARVSELVDEGVARELARSVATMPSLPPVFDVVAVAELTDHELEDVMHTYFRLASRLELAWLRDRIYALPRANRWQALARAALRDDLMRAHRELTQEVLEAASDGHGGEEAIEEWAENRSAALERVLGTLTDIRASRTYDTTTLPVALREVRSLIRGGEGEPSGSGHR
ncbi:MAG TPA: NAD-glutamate dehydrogenase [Solirubrobacteraceae bacterium]|nr:NAD-glutamate dehydrogenase [Solirubrobacteraceae bacterium]